MFRWIFSLALLASACPALADSCTEQVPTSLRSRLEGSFPGFYFPRESGNAPANVGAEHDRGFSGCLGVVAGDFDGDDSQDLAVAMTAADGEGALIVTISDAQGRAVMTTLDQQRRGRRALSLGTGRAGLYERTRAGIGGMRRLSAGEAERIDCAETVLIISASETSARAYCNAQGGWRWVQTAD
jgi:hypothetical protein